MSSIKFRLIILLKQQMVRITKFFLTVYPCKQIISPQQIATSAVGGLGYVVMYHLLHVVVFPVDKRPAPTGLFHFCLPNSCGRQSGFNVDFPGGITLVGFTWRQVIV